MIRSISNMKIYLASLLIACFQVMLASSSYSSFTINHLQGLSNSAVLSILQDNQGLMWFGTYDGLNCYDGRTIDVFRTDFSKGRTLDNNIISRSSALLSFRHPDKQNHLTRSVLRHILQFCSLRHDSFLSG